MYAVVVISTESDPCLPTHHHHHQHHHHRQCSSQNISAEKTASMPVTSWLLLVRLSCHALKLRRRTIMQHAASHHQDDSR